MAAGLKIYVGLLCKLNNSLSFFSLGVLNLKEVMETVNTVFSHSKVLDSCVHNCIHNYEIKCILISCSSDGLYYNTTTASVTIISEGVYWNSQQATSGPIDYTSDNV